jgi:hypothetical protein
MDRFELCVDQGRLYDGRQPIVVDRIAQIGEQSGDIGRGRGDESSAARVVVVAADPVLVGANTASDLTIDRPFGQTTVNGNDVGDAESLGACRMQDRQFHCIDVGEDLRRNRTCGSTRFGARFRARQLTYSELEPLDL